MKQLSTHLILKHADSETLERIEVKEMKNDFENLLAVEMAKMRCGPFWEFRLFKKKNPEAQLTNDD